MIRRVCLRLCVECAQGHCARQGADFFTFPCLHLRHDSLRTSAVEQRANTAANVAAYPFEFAMRFSKSGVISPARVLERLADLQMRE